MSSEMHTAITADGHMDLFIAKPDDGAKGGIVVVQEAFGLTPHIQDVCRRVAAAGYYAVSPALYHRADEQVFEYENIKGALPAMQTLSRESIDMDLDVAFAHLASHGFSGKKVGLVGFCMGGSVALYVASTRHIGASVTYYGGGLTQARFGFDTGLEMGEHIKAPWLGLYGDLDQSIPFDDVEKLRAIASKCPVPTEVVRYAEGQHGFNCDDRPAVFNKAIADDAWTRTLNWFSTHLK